MLGIVLRNDPDDVGSVSRKRRGENSEEAEKKGAAVHGVRIDANSVLEKPVFASRH